MKSVLEIKNLKVNIPLFSGKVEPVRNVSLTLNEGEILAIVGESGCGKSMLLKSIMRLLPEKAVIETGEILINGIDVTKYREKEMTKLRGSLFSYIFQDPFAALDPTMTIGQQIAEAIITGNNNSRKEFDVFKNSCDTEKSKNDKKLEKGDLVRLEKTNRISKQEIAERVIELLTLVGIKDPEKCIKMYSYNLSGGMRQRCVMAIALASNPRILLADEPTTSLDVTVQAQILDLLKSIQQKLNMSTILVSHDLSVVARVADRVAVMYAGKIVEIGTAEDIFYSPKHLYTKALLKSLPAYSKDRKALEVIPGMPPTLVNMPKGDAFARRNPEALAIDYVEEPPLFKVSETHYAATWTLYEGYNKVNKDQSKENKD